MREKVCPKHGPYDAALHECPYCAAERGASLFPPPPAPLERAAPQLAAEPVIPETGQDFPAFLEDQAPEVAEDLEHTLLGEPEPPKAEIWGLLWVKAGPLRGKVLPIRHGTVLGRTQGDVILRDPRASNPHAKITLEEDTFVLWDFGSTNGTFVNGERIRTATPIRENDEIRIGDTVLVLKVLKP